jgi:uncharacterized protein
MTSMGHSWVNGHYLEPIGGLRRIVQVHLRKPPMTALWNRFLPLLEARDLRTRPLRIHTENEVLALFRGADGVPALVLDRCPHRFASLSDGAVRADGRLACPYHGWNFDGAGCGKSPSQPERTDCDTQAYAAIEANGFIWVAPQGTEQPKELRAPNGSVGIWRKREKCALLRKGADVVGELSFPVHVPETGLSHGGAAKEAVRYQRLLVSASETETSDIRSWTFVREDGRPLPAHRAGQHILVRVALAGALKVRPYSLSAASNNGKSWRISVKRVRHEGKGLVSGHLHDSLQVGQAIEAAGPFGEFYEPEPHRASVFVAVGVGITPLFAMLAAWDKGGRKVPAWLLYGVRSQADVFRPSELEELARAGLNVRFYVSQGPLPAANTHAQCAQWERGRVNAAALQSLRQHDPNVFLCGPAAMMHAFQSALQGYGFSAAHIFAERFTSAVDQRFSGSALASLKAAKVTLLRSNRELLWSHESGTLLELAAGAGVSLYSGCEVGSCGTCRIRVLSGSTMALGKQRENEEAGSCLVCTSVPRGDIVLDA